ncbi:radical SAM family heme chaperone HemW [Qingshengfaniella alkalisoli]|uniref:radical SAM family heme chaperone HemW n=1 Tax=Qingshengfaniella alkalisoli TaxID=2599296 RepID=UPI001F106259|nr:radical SAM family heme chaperone HemW [Qingshengfaniella alkalisoli]
MTERPDWENGGFGLYIHWPFCAAKCPYCDFNSHVADTIDHTRWKSAYLNELRRSAEETQGRILRSVFFGGGTPSLMDPDTVAEVLSEVHRLWPVANDLEVTLEANPTSVEAGRFRAFRDGGVSRISMGIQSLKDDDLRQLGRLHSVDEAKKAFEIARTAFERVSFDLIYARQNQSLRDWEAELTEALEMAIDHLSLYQLTIEPGTAFGARHAKGGLKGLPADSLAADMFDLTQDVCARYGMPAYEVSNHARDGAESRHNLVYWRYGDYIGIGPGAHGRITDSRARFATETPLAPGKWLEQVEQTGSGESMREALSLEDQATEYLLMSLRLNEGTDLARLRSLGYSPDDDTLIQLQQEGLIDIAGRHLSTTSNGRLLLNAVLRQLLEA